MFDFSVVCVGFSHVSQSEDKSRCLLFVVCATEHWNWDTWTGEEQEGDYGDEEYEGEEHGASGPHCDDEDFIVS